MLGGEGLQGHFEKQIATWWRNWFPPPPPKMTAWCIIWLHAVRVLDRDNLSNPTGDLIVLTRATLSTFWLCACQGSSRQDPWGKKFLCSIQILNCSLFPFCFHTTRPKRQTRLFTSFLIMNEPGSHVQQLCSVSLAKPSHYTLLYNNSY